MAVHFAFGVVSLYAKYAMKTKTPIAYIEYSKSIVSTIDISIEYFFKHSFSLISPSQVKIPGDVQSALLRDADQ
jgi:hypothetical protein